MCQASEVVLTLPILLFLRLALYDHTNRKFLLFSYTPLPLSRVTICMCYI